MRAIDTNILVRFIMNDTPSQAQKVFELFCHARQNQEKLFVPVVVVMELEWALSYSYQLPRDVMLQAMFEILKLDVLCVEHDQAVFDCLENATQNTFDVSDLLIGYVARANGCLSTITFDKKAGKSPLFEPLK